MDLTKVPGGQDDSFEKRIVADELPGVARRGVIGLRRLMERGAFERPASVQTAFQEFEHRLDPVRAWVSARCDISDTTAWTYRTDLFNHYQGWAIGSQYRPMSNGKFYERLESAGYRQRKHDNARGFIGLQLLIRRCCFQGNQAMRWPAERS